MSNLNRLQTLFDKLPPDERKAFVAQVKDSVRAQSFNMTDLITSKEDEGIKCPHCQTLKVVKFGKRRGIQWYRCKTCGKTFSSTTGSFLSCTKKDFHTWKTFVKCMIDGHSVRKSAAICKINRNTAFVWRHKILDALTQYQNSQRRMRGIVEADDTYFGLSFKGDEPLNRKARKRGSQTTKRGISKEKVCVSCAVDRNGHTYSKVSALGRPTAKALKKVFRNRFSKKAIVITDGDKAYVRFAARSKFDHIRIPNGLTSIDVYHVQNINAYHSRLKHFIASFRGVSTKYLNNYLVWNNVIREAKLSRITLLKLCIKAETFTRWHNISARPAIPV